MSPFVSPPTPVYAVGSPVPHAVTSTDSGSTPKLDAMMCGFAAAAAVIVGAVGGVVAPLNFPPSKRPPTPPHLILLPSPGSGAQLPVLAPLLAQSNDASGVKSNPTFALRSSSTKPVGPGTLMLAQITTITAMTMTAKMA